jgi:NifU-like protein
MHCSVMGRDALEKAIAFYRGEAEKKVEGEIVCECFGVTDREIERAVRENSLRSIEDVTNFVKAGGACGNCHENIQQIIDTVLGTEKPAVKKPARLTNIQKIKLVEETLEREIKPALQQDGGDIELVDVDGNTVFLRLCGNCAACSASEITLKHYVETKLQEFVTPEIVVEEVTG